MIIAQITSKMKIKLPVASIIAVSFLMIPCSFPAIAPFAQYTEEVIINKNAPMIKNNTTGGIVAIDAPETTDRIIMTANNNTAT